MSFGRLRKGGFDTPEVRRYVEWVANESHFARYFTKSTFDEITSECHWFACQEGESKAVLAAACMIRSAYEFKAITSIFCELVDAGVESSLAYIIATLTRGGNYDTGTGHTALYSAPVSALVGQAMRSLNTKASAIYEASGSSIHYGVDVCQVKDALIKLNIATKDGYGYFRVQQPIKKEERLKVAEVLAKLITEELTILEERNLVVVTMDVAKRELMRLLIIEGRMYVLPTSKLNEISKFYITHHHPAMSFEHTFIVIAAINDKYLTHCLVPR